MNITDTPIPDLKIIEPRIFPDERGYFFESYNYEKFLSACIEHTFVQDNQSKSVYGVIRGLHYQLPPYAQTKLIRVLHGKILDTVVDIREKSPSFGKVFAIELCAEYQKQLLIPKGFAHGFSVLSETAIILYKCDTLYNPESERGICYNDPTLAIDWKIEKSKALVSTKDKVLPLLHEAEMNFVYGDT